MIKKKRFYFFFLVVFLLLFGCGSNSPKSDFSVTFKTIPSYIPKNEKVYLTGNHDQLGKWRPDAVLLREQPDGSWTRTLNFPAGTILEYKFTRGTWTSEAADSFGWEFPNFKLVV